jgi:orotate phosphoribosyltransferase-like protein
VLDGRDRRIFEARRLAGEQITLAELANELGVSRERVRQLEVRAFEKVQKAVKKRVERCAIIGQERATTAHSVGWGVGDCNPTDGRFMASPWRA